MTGSECDLTPYRYNYDSINNVQIVKVATAWQSTSSVQVYILVFNEALWMVYSMNHSLINPNQLHHFGTIVHDNPSSGDCSGCIVVVKCCLSGL